MGNAAAPLCSLSIPVSIPRRRERSIGNHSNPRAPEEGEVLDLHQRVAA